MFKCSFLRILWPLWCTQALQRFDCLLALGPVVHFSIQGLLRCVTLLPRLGLVQQVGQILMRNAGYFLGEQLFSNHVLHHEILYCLDQLLRVDFDLASFWSGMRRCSGWLSLSVSLTGGVRTTSCWTFDWLGSSSLAVAAWSREYLVDPVDFLVGVEVLQASATASIYFVKSQKQIWGSKFKNKT